VEAIHSDGDVGVDDRNKTTYSQMLSNGGALNLVIKIKKIQCSCLHDVVISVSLPMPVVQ